MTSIPHIPAFALAWLLTLGAVGPGAQAASDPGATRLGSTPRDNEVVLTMGDGVRSLWVEYLDSRISESEPLGGVSIHHLSDGLQLVIEAPRKGTEEVAQDLLERMNGEAWHMVGSMMTDHKTAPSPKKLNFWTSFRLWINDVEIPDGLYLAQGHHESRNNWWAANRKAVYRPYSGDLRIPDGKQGLYCLREATGRGVNHFLVEDCMAPPPVE